MFGTILLLVILVFIIVGIKRFMPADSEPFKTILFWVVALCFAVVLIGFLLSLAGHPLSFWPRY